MILTPVDRRNLPELVNRFALAVAGHARAAAVLARVLATPPLDGDLGLSTDARHHAQGIAQCRAFGFEIIDVDPRDYFTWDGRAVAARMEPSLLLHEIAHYQVAAPRRRGVLDFGLGGGPETGRKAEADAVRTVSDLQADVEEGLASLLGILWEAELGQPALPAFLEQNWLEGGVDRRNVGHFLKIVDRLAAHGLIDPHGRPTRALRTQDDAAFMAGW